jgi:hypothetical protein
MIRRLLMMCGVALAACSGSTSGSIEATLGAPLQLAPGQTAVLSDGLEVQFAGIAADSRCPSDVTCVWAGEVVARLAVRDERKTSQHEVREMQSAPIGGYSVSVLQVLPARATSQPIAASDYRVTLKITRQRVSAIGVGF